MSESYGQIYVPATNYTATTDTAANTDHGGWFSWLFLGPTHSDSSYDSYCIGTLQDSE